MEKYGKKYGQEYLDQNSVFSLLLYMEKYGNSKIQKNTEIWKYENMEKYGNIWKDGNPQTILVEWENSGKEDYKCETTTERSCQWVFRLDRQCMWISLQVCDIFWCISNLKEPIWPV